MPPPSWRSRAASTGRADRIGPTRGASWDWYVASSRVRPPSTSASVTMSALLRPDCGFAGGELSTLIESAGLCITLGTTKPVSGATAGPLDVLVLLPPPQLAARNAEVDRAKRIAPRLHPLRRLRESAFDFTVADTATG